MQYDDTVEAFESATADSAKKTADSAMLSVAASGDNLEVKDALKPRECGPESDLAPSAGNLLKWTTNRIYKEGLNIDWGDSHQKIVFKFKNIDTSKGYTVEIPLQICSTVPDSATFKVEDMKIKAYSAEDTAAQYFLGESKLAFNGDAMVLKLEIKPDTAWNGTICLRIYNDKIEKKEDSAKMELYFDNIVLKETNA